MTPEKFKTIYSQKTYLGDGLYAHFDGYHIILTAPREGGDHFVALDPSVFHALSVYREKVYADANTIQYEEKK